MLISPSQNVLNHYFQQLRVSKSSIIFSPLKDPQYKIITWFTEPFQVQKPLIKQVITDK